MKKKIKKVKALAKAKLKKKAPAKKAKRAAKKAISAKPKSEKLIIMNIKLTSKDRAALLKRAKLHAKSNFSAWVRHAGLKYVPKKGEVVVSKPSAYGK